MLLGDPLSTRNRQHYVPPSRPSFTENDITIDLLREEAEPEPEIVEQKPQKFSKDAILTLIQTTYSLLVIAFFKSLVDKVKRKPLLSEEREPLPLPSAENTMDVQPIEPVSNEPEIKKLRSSQVRNPDPYESLFEIDSDSEIDDCVQYGTSLAISKSSFKPRNTEEEHAQHILHSTTILNNRLLNSDIYKDESVADFFAPSKPTDEYDIAVHKFYHPFKPIPEPRKTLTESLLASFPPVKSILREEQRKIQNLVTTERTSSRAAVPELAKDQLEVVQRYWGTRNGSVLVVSAFSIDLTVRDLSTLADGQWLNDNIIDFYLNMVTDQNKAVYCWTTHFYTTLKQKGYQGVARWAKRRKINVFEKDRVIVPINIMGTHWALAVIDNRRKRISYFDSLASRGNIAAVELLQVYMSKEAERLLLPQVTYDLIPGEKTPQQQNGYDCGVFTCTVAKCISGEQPLRFSQQDMRNIRRRMAYEIILQKLLDIPHGPSAHL